MSGKGWDFPSFPRILTTVSVYKVQETVSIRRQILYPWAFFGDFVTIMKGGHYPFADFKYDEAVSLHFCYHYFELLNVINNFTLIWYSKSKISLAALKYIFPTSRCQGTILFVFYFYWFHMRVRIYITNYSEVFVCEYPPVWNIFHCSVPLDQFPTKLSYSTVAVCCKNVVSIT